MIHHLAIAVKNVANSHHFYTVVMGFKLVAAVKRQAPGGGWTKHLFYDMGDGDQFALWDLRGIEGVQIEPDAWRSAVSSGLGLPRWVNHVAFRCSGEQELQERKQRWLDHGYTVSDIHHDMIHSIYAFDPDGNLVEWTYDTRPLTEEDRLEAERILADDTPPTEPEYDAVITRATKPKFHVQQPAR
jgi:catechol 2,3-dioxygenase-like lactoylglutathione lyase family enzyme